MVFEMFVVVQPGKRLSIDAAWLLELKSLVESIDDAD
jgi:hypothetical protein